MGILGLLVIVWFVALAVALGGFVQAVHDIREQRAIVQASGQARPHHGLGRPHLRHARAH